MRISKPIVSVLFAVLFTTLMSADSRAEQRKGDLRITSFPDAANVSVDGNQIEKITPMTLHLGFGPHKILVFVPNSGWMPAARDVVVGRDDVEVNVTLMPALTVGPQGPQGPVGPRGQMGPTGATGPQGVQGPAGPQGATGLQGPKGDVGATGAQGPKGDTGPAGAMGATGPVGPQGLKGDTGDQGLQGPAGAVGAQGPKGDTGAMGAQGPKGDTGPAGATGATGPMGPQGLKGDTGDQGLQGLAGAVGPQGPKGDTGATGAIGPIGATGAQGPKGDTGANGAAGPVGPVGQQGSIGPQGLKGDTGATGAAGPQGPTGPQGPVGPQGPAGPLNPYAYVDPDNRNTAVGPVAMSLAPRVGSYNTALGYAALQNANTSLSGNVGIGFATLGSLTAGSTNVAIGFQAGSSLSTGSNNIYLSNNGISTEANTVRIGASQNRTFIAGISNVNVVNGSQVVIDQNGQLGTIASSRRFKQDIHDMGDASDALMKLRPVVFRYKPEYDHGQGGLQFGLIAEEVAKVYPELVQFSPKGEAMTVYYHLLTTMLLNELQKEHHQVEVQQQQIDDLTDRLTKLERSSQTEQALYSPALAPKR